MRWKNALASVAVIPLLSLSALADPGDEALDAILQKLKTKDTVGALADLNRIPALSVAQLIRARYYRAYAHRQQGDYAGAIAEFQGFLPTALASQKDRDAFKSTGGVFAVKSELAYADTLFQAEDYAKASQAYGTFTSDFPQDAQLRYAALRREESLRNSGAAQVALDYLKTLPKGDPDWEIPVAVRQAELLAQYLRTDFDLSNRLVESIIAKYPNHPSIRDAKCRLARNWLYDRPAEQRDYAKARQIEEQLIAENPDWNMIFDLKLDIANSHYFEKDYPQAVAAYQALLGTYPDTYPADDWQAHCRFLIGDSYAHAKDATKARATWNDLANRYPGDPWAALAANRVTALGSQEAAR